MKFLSLILCWFLRRFVANTKEMRLLINTLSSLVSPVEADKLFLNWIWRKGKLFPAISVGKYIVEIRYLALEKQFREEISWKYFQDLFCLNGGRISLATLEEIFESAEMAHQFIALCMAYKLVVLDYDGASKQMSVITHSQEEQEEREWTQQLTA